MLILENLCCKRGGFRLEDVNLRSGRGDYFVLLGPSGSGKTTLIKCICGLNPLSSGRIRLNDRDITSINPEDRRIGYVPQNYSLFPHLDVYQNILFGLKAMKLPKGECDTRVESISDMLGINNLMRRRVNNLSGGEMQRIALARALVVYPDAILLDEPFSSVEPGLRTRLWFEIKGTLKRTNTIVIHITHNLDEAYALGDRIAVLIDGRIEQDGTREDITRRPATEKIADYQGIKNIFEGEISDVGENKIRISNPGFEIIAFKGKEAKLGRKVRFCIRPQDIKIIKEDVPVKENLMDNLFEGEVVSAYFCYDFTTIVVRSSVEFELRFPSYIYVRYKLYTGKRVKFGIWQNGINLFP